MEIEEEFFGSLKNRDEIKKITLKNPNGIAVSLINYGAIIQSVILPDRYGELSNVVLNYDNLEEYIKDSSYLGATVGRFANRIRGGSFRINNEIYQLARNEKGITHLHGGDEGFGKKYWSYKCWKTERVASVRMRYISPDGEEGYPGELDTEITFTLDINNSFIINYKCSSDKVTPVNLTNHSYFNLTGTDTGATVLGHLLKINSSLYLETDNNLIPTGKFLDVKDGFMNFRELRRIGELIKGTAGKTGVTGYDDCYVLAVDEGKMFHAVTAADPLSGRMIDLFTDQPGVQLYTANYMDPPHCAVCFETQNFPDSVNNPDFPNPFISPGDIYNRTTFFRFTIFNDYV